MTTKKHEVPEELKSGLLANYKKPEDLIGENGLLKQPPCLHKIQDTPKSTMATRWVFSWADCCHGFPIKSGMTVLDHCCAIPAVWITAV